MKTYLIALFVLSFGVAFGQIPGPVPPDTGTWTTARIGQLQKQLRQTFPAPAGGFWVVEGSPKQSAIIHYYTGNRQEIHADTLTKKWVNLKRRAVVGKLNKRLSVLLGESQRARTVALHE